MFTKCTFVFYNNVYNVHMYMYMNGLSSFKYLFPFRKKGGGAIHTDSPFEYMCMTVLLSTDTGTCMLASLKDFVFQKSSWLGY